MEWVQQGLLTLWTTNQLTDLHVWSAVGSSMRWVAEAGLTDVSTLAATEDLHLGWCPPLEGITDSEAWEWSPPDLSPGSPWHKARVERLFAVTQNMSDRDRHRAAGLRALEVH